MDITRRDSSLALMARREEEASVTRTLALFSVDGDPTTFRNRVELPEEFELNQWRQLRLIPTVTLADGRRGVEGDR